jgi:hypothetical protein
MAARPARRLATANGLAFRPVYGQLHVLSMLSIIKSMASKSTNFRFIGQPIPRTEDARLLTGRGQFSDDFSFPRPDLCGVGSIPARACPHRSHRYRRRQKNAGGNRSVYRIGLSLPTI